MNIDMSEVLRAVSGFTDRVNTLFTGKVDKVEGKQLTTEDFTPEDKTKLQEVKSMAMRDLHVGTVAPTQEQGADGDVWIILKP